MPQKRLLEAKFRCISDTGYCAFPVGGDTYKNCSHGCLYCYEPQLSGQHHASKNIRPRDYRGLFRSLADDPETWYFTYEKRIPVQLGSVCDPMQVIERREKVTLNLLRLLNAAKIGVILSTKSPNQITGEYVDLLLQMKEKHSGGVVKTSISTMDETKAARLEPGAPSVNSRLENMKRLREAGLKTVVRIEPLLHTEQYDLKTIAECADGITVEPMRYSVTWRNTWPIEFWEIIYNTTRGKNEKSWALDMEKKFFAHYRNDEIPYHSDGYHWILMDPFRLRQIYDPIKKEAEELGMTFGICTFDFGIQNVDMNNCPYGCCVDSKLNYDEMNLVTSWHKDNWASWQAPAMKNIDMNLAVIRLVVANMQLYKPIVVGGGDSIEGYWAGEDEGSKGGGGAI